MLKYIIAELCLYVLFNNLQCNLVVSNPAELKKIFTPAIGSCVCVESIHGQVHVGEVIYADNRHMLLEVFDIDECDVVLVEIAMNEVKDMDVVDMEDDDND